jgi:hypothetical protein
MDGSNAEEQLAVSNWQLARRGSGTIFWDGFLPQVNAEKTQMAKN